jgi:cation diffusion facilitator family transporter
MLALPRGVVLNMQGIMQAITNVCDRLGVAGIVSLTATLITISGIGQAGAWFAACGRLPFVAGVDRLLHPATLEAVGWGLVVSAVASLVNLGVALRLRRAGRLYQSITLEADAQHLLTDVWTSVGVLIGVGVVALTGWQWLDPLVALAVGVNIVRSGVDLVRRSVLGLLDTAIPLADRAALQRVLESYGERGIEWHALRTRQAGARRFVSLHVLVPGAWTVQRGHDLLEEVERDIRAALGTVTVFTHLEPVEDPVAWEDVGLDRGTDARARTATERRQPG